MKLTSSVFLIAVAVASTATIAVCGADLRIVTKDQAALEATFRAAPVANDAARPAARDVFLAQSSTCSDQPVGGRSAHSLTYDTVRRRVVMFGGQSANPNDPYPAGLWAWSGQRWACIAPASPNGPSGRVDAFLAFDPARERLVLFGGRRFGADGKSEFLIDTWEWDGRTWSERDTAGPGPRIHGAIAYDPDRRAVVLHGGGSPRGALTDSWSWDGQRWTEIAVRPQPVGVGDALVALPRIVGAGLTLISAITDTAPECSGLRRVTLSRLHGGTMIDLKAAGPCFSPQAPVAATSEGLLLYAGWDGPSAPAATWTWSAAGWTRRTQAPPKRRGTAMAYDARRNLVVLFGGEDERGVLGDTWEWDGAGWKDVK